MTIHNFSTHELTKSDTELLSKGLSFVPTPKFTPEKMHIDLLCSYDKFAHSLRILFIKRQKNPMTKDTSPDAQATTTHTSSQVYRSMKFLTKPPYTTPNELYSGYNQVENYIDGTKMILDQQLPQICKLSKSNLPVAQRKSLFKLKK